MSCSKSWPSEAWKRPAGVVRSCGVIVASLRLPMPGTLSSPGLTPSNAADAPSRRPPESNMKTFAATLSMTANGRPWASPATAHAATSRTSPEAASPRKSAAV
jgi:hypothetical protein